VLRNPTFFLWQFLHEFNFVDSDEAMKRGDEVLNASVLQFVRNVQRFIASSLQILTQR
jgi:hypothetical protein